MTTRPPVGDPPLADLFWAAALVHEARGRLRRSLLALHASPFDEDARQAVLLELSDPEPLLAVRRLESMTCAHPWDAAGRPGGAGGPDSSASSPPPLS